MLGQYIWDKGNVAALGGEGSYCYFESFEMMMLVRVVFKVVVLCGNCEAAYREVCDLYKKVVTASLIQLTRF